MRKCLKHWPFSTAHTRAFKCLTAFGGVVADEKMVKDMMNEALNRMKQKNGWNDEETLEQFGVFVQANFPEIWEAAGKKVLALDEEDFDFFSASWEVQKPAVEAVARAKNGSGCSSITMASETPWNASATSLLNQHEPTSAKPFGMASK